MIKRFVCYGGYVISVNDGDLHYISAHQVAHLHGVNPRECILIDEETNTIGLDVSHLLLLRPHDEAYLRVGPAERRQYPTNLTLNERLLADVG